MCGIVGMIGKGDVALDIVDSLKRLEYRGYDSAGVATLNDGVVDRRRAEGKLVNLESVLKTDELRGTTGIGHTRWATHGKPTTRNAHPHWGGNVAIVHNGIIENFSDLKDELLAKGVEFESDTDTEVVAHLINQDVLTGKSPEEAMKSVLPRLHGAFALGVIFKGHDDLIIAARKGSPLAIGHGKGQMFIGSDAISLAPFTSKITYLEEGDWAVVERESVQIYDEANTPVKRAMNTSSASAMLVDKGNHRHFMIKEIYEQPEVVSHTFSHYADLAKGCIRMDADLPFDFAKLSRLTMSACGTAYYAGCIAKYWFEHYARLPVDIDVASEFRYRKPPLEKDGLSLFISQSGETADTLAALRYCKEQDQHIAAIVNVQESTIARESDAIFPTLAGPEIGVASTKALISQLTVLAALVIMAAKARGTIDGQKEKELVRAITELPRAISRSFGLENQAKALSQSLSKASDVLYLGRGAMYPVAMEGALKLKEISYIHAEAYASGELKHGPIALIDEVMPVVVVAPKDDLFDKTISNMEEVAARGGRIILITDEAGASDYKGEVEHVFIVPDIHEFVMPILAIVPVQLLAYHTAVFMGTDVDQPRNLAKSVTVE